MKKLLWLPLLLGFFFVFPRIATAQTPKTYTSNDAYNFSLTVNSTTSVSGEMTFPAAKKGTYAGDVCIIDSSQSDCSAANLVFKKYISSITTKSVNVPFSVTNLNPNKVYYFIVDGINGAGKYEFFTGDTVLQPPAIDSKQDKNDVIVWALMDPAKYPFYKQLSASLIYSLKSDLSDPIYNGAISGKQTDDPNSPTGPNPGGNANYTEGTFYWRLSNLKPSTIYYFQITVSSKNTGSVKSPIDNFNSSNGTVIAPGSDAQTADLNQRSYHLLSGFPNFSVLPDPDLCAQERAAGQHPQFCDMNDVINYALKLLIGLSAVVLVFRLMYEGYKYMVSDVPFLKASAKSGFFTSLMGLLLAMSSYLILNTINPKLVSESVGVNQLSITVDGDTNTPTTFVPNGQLPAGVQCPSTGRSSAVAAVAKSFIGKVTYKYGGKSAGAQSDGNASLDCSAWANTVLKCSGFATPGDYKNSGSSDIFAGAEQVNMSSGFTISADGKDVFINNKKLNPGDLVGWPQTTTYGHVILYVGNGTFMDSHSNKTAGGAIGTYSAVLIKSSFGGSNPTKTITAVKRIPV